MLLEPGEKLVQDVYENLPCCLNLFNKRKIKIALNKESPDFNFINGNNIKNKGAASKILPAKISITAKSTEKIIIKNLILFETFSVFALANAVKTRAKIIKIIIPKKTKFIY